MSAIEFDTHPDRYRHWELSIDGPIASLGMKVVEDGGLRPDYVLKLNSYDLGVDIELADAVQRIRFEHPEVRTVVVRSLIDGAFCSGANIFMLGSSTHAFKVNFCKFTNETRLSFEDASAHSGLKFLCAVNGACAGGGYELALACDEILLIDDGSSAVSLPEVPLLAVLPGTGGLTRVVDKRKVRPDLADVFCTVAEGVRGRRAKEWGLVDDIAPRSKFDEAVATRALQLAEGSDRPIDEPGIPLLPLQFTDDADAGTRSWRHVVLTMDPERRVADLLVRAPDGAGPTDAAAMKAAGSDLWALRAFRELDAALLHLRLNLPELGTITLRTAGEADAVVASDRAVLDHADDWWVREVLHHMKRVLKRLDVTARTVFALIEPGSCFAGSLFELALAADRAYMLDDPDQPVRLQVCAINRGPLTMANGLTRLQTRFLGQPDLLAAAMERDEPLESLDALDAGLVTFAPDDIDWEDEIRLALEERASQSPDALTGMEANLRFAGPETLETKIFGRLSAWQNWIFQRPNAVGAKGALTVYGQAGARPEFNWERT